MTSTINASTSGGGGIIQTADSSGTLALQGGGNTGVSISSAGIPTITTPTISGAMTTAYPVNQPQGRLTLATNTPVMTSAQTAKTTIYYTAYVGNQVPIYDGTNWALHAFTSDLSNITTNSSTGNAGPAATTTNSNYDLFVWRNSGTLTLTRGPAWTSDTARGTGAGTTQLTMTDGIWTNTVAITNGPGAGLGTYVGTIRTDGSSQCNWNPTPAAAAGGAEAKLHVYNAYNKIFLVGSSADSNGWNYTTTTWRSMDNSTSNRISYVDGLGDLSVITTLSIRCATTNTAAVAYFGCNRNSTSATPTYAQYVVYNNADTAGTYMNQAAFLPSLGFNYLQAMESGNSGWGQATPQLTAQFTA